ncbi:MAG: hypothetical protein HOG74_05645 [Nitrospina sp.]|nr:hypothetical protein [Nitrospina sp.]
MITKPEDICLEIESSLVQSDLFSKATQTEKLAPNWRVSPEPYYLSSEEILFFEDLGCHLLKFYTVLNSLYSDSVKGKIPSWFAKYLDAGKPDDLVAYSRMKRIRGDLPGIIRPDIMVTGKGFSITELDSVPGGFGLTARLMDLYSSMDEIVGMSEGGIPEAFYKMAESVSGEKSCVVAIIVSDEANDYWGEMSSLSQHLNDKGFPVFALKPQELIFREEGLFFKKNNNEVKVDVLYRFFELFDLKNIPKAELIMYSCKKGRVKITPPFKPYLEEKLAFSLFKHPVLTSLWEKELGCETFSILSHLIPETWILDSREVPDYAVIPGLDIGGKLVQNWKELISLTKKERELVIKPSGFSPESWGSRGVVIGHDVSAEVWEKTLEDSLAKFPEGSSVLQVFHKGRRVRVRYRDSGTDSIVEMESRVRLTPYYFLIEGSARLAGILATLCPHDKKKIHGMSDAVLIPCAKK